MRFDPETCTHDAVVETRIRAAEAAESDWRDFTVPRIPRPRHPEPPGLIDLTTRTPVPNPTIGDVCDVLGPNTYPELVRTVKAVDARRWTLRTTQPAATIDIDGLPIHTAATPDPDGSLVAVRVLAAGQWLPYRIEFVRADQLYRSTRRHPD